ncbi:MAG: hypothetical protein ACR2G7_13895 [Acidimicrobiales bacterium]
MTVSRRRLDAIARQLPPSQTKTVAAMPTNIIEFASDPRFLGMRLYPRQATVLKIITLATELFTSYDISVINAWTKGYRESGGTSDRRWEGSEGTPGDILERIEWCRAHGRRWFREVLLVVGRRGSKNVIGAIVGAWVIWHVLHEPAVGMKSVTVPVYAGKKSQAMLNQFTDMRRAIENAPCFAPYIVETTSEAIYLASDDQIDGGRVMSQDAYVHVRAAETTLSGPRGSAVPAMFLDEFAHVLGAGSTASSTELYEAAVPGQSQFPKDNFCLQTSSPWDRQGQLYRSYTLAMATEPGTGAPMNPDLLIFQLPSWNLYLDWTSAPEIPMWPGGPTFAELDGPIIEHNEQLRRQEAANPESFAVEMRAQWRSSLSAYLSDTFITRVFAPWRGAPLTHQTNGALGTTYVAAGDPSVSQANFGFAIAHLERVGDVDHVVFDVLHAWKPKDFPDGIVDYMAIQEEIYEFIRVFGITELTFDHVQSALLIQRLQARTAKFPKRLNVYKRPATAQQNWERYETFKTAIGHNLIHAPDHDLAAAELGALQVENRRVSAPTTGPTRTKDVVDAMVNVVHTLLGENAQALFDQLAATPLRATQPADWPVPRLVAPAARPVNPDQAIFDALSRYGRPRKAVLRSHRVSGRASRFGGKRW